MPTKDKAKRRAASLKYQNGNREKVKAANRARYERNAERYQTAAALKRRMWRRRLAQLCGGKCRDCPITDERVIEFHHADSKGNADRRAVPGGTYQYYKRLCERVKKDPNAIVMTCANCHRIRHWIPDDEL